MPFKLRGSELASNAVVVDPVDRVCSPADRDETDAYREHCSLTIGPWRLSSDTCSSIIQALAKLRQAFDADRAQSLQTHLRVMSMAVTLMLSMSRPSPMRMLVYMLVVVMVVMMHFRSLSMLVLMLKGASRKRSRG